MDISPQGTAFILDFDGTITTKDTISTLLNFALLTHASKGKDFSAARDKVVAKYSEDYTKHVEDYTPVREERNTLAKEIQYYRSLKGVETRSFERVSNSGLFKGISESDWAEFGRDAVRKGEVIVREGFKDFIVKVNESSGVWGVVSVNFSSHFIRGVLASASSSPSAAEVLSNQPDENGVLNGPDIGDGHYGPVMATSDDKLSSKHDLLRSLRPLAGEDFSNVVFIGDSGTDTECLSEEGTLGIIMSDDGRSSVIESLERVGVKVKHVGDYLGEGTSVFWARNFQEIVDSPVFTLVPSE